MSGTTLENQGSDGSVRHTPQKRDSPIMGGKCLRSRGQSNTRSKMSVKPGPAWVHLLSSPGGAFIVSEGSKPGLAAARGAWVRQAVWNASSTRPMPCRLNAKP